MRMAQDDGSVVRFRRELSRLRASQEHLWEESRRHVTGARLARTVHQLAAAADHSTLPQPLKDLLVRALRVGQAVGRSDVDGDTLKLLTGLPTTKALRALSLYFGLVTPPTASWPAPTTTPEEVEAALRKTEKPFDLLLDADVASVLDLGAGDLSFAEELVQAYQPRLQAQGKDLILHCQDRLAAESQLGGPLHPDRARLERLKSAPGVRFRFLPGVDMFALDEPNQRRAFADRYTIVTCWAPATPTFAYEPSRLSRDVINDDLRRTKGPFRKVKVDGEEALEVQHGSRALLFPAWKFEIRGPLALLDLMSQRGLVCVLGAVDGQVFWETLSQLLADPNLRPTDRILTPSLVPKLFGPVFQRLTQLPVGTSIDLSTVARLRADLPRVLGAPSDLQASYAFRYVLIRRGATFDGVPASSTARRFPAMVEEAPPWFLTLVPERVFSSST